MTLDWLDSAACAQVGGDEWFPERGHPATDARAICDGHPDRGIPTCPVRDQCLQWALDQPDLYGIWGGTNRRERERLRRPRAPQELEEAA